MTTMNLGEPPDVTWSYMPPACPECGEEAQDDDLAHDTITSYECYGCGAVFDIHKRVDYWYRREEPDASW
jgi:hypothetical protein